MTPSSLLSRRRRAFKAPFRAFTLVELLIAIALIVFLIALLFPLQRAISNKTRATRCIVNLQQITSALLLYRADHNGELLPDENNGSGSSHWTGAVDAYLGIPKPVSTLGNSPVWSCPANPAAPSSTSKNGPGKPPFSASHVSYVRNRNLLKQDGSWSAWSANRVGNSLTLILVIERRVGPISGTGVALSSLTSYLNEEGEPDGGFFDHPQGTSVAFVDGHIEQWPRTHVGLGGGKAYPASVKAPDIDRYWNILQ